MPEFYKRRPESDNLFRETLFAFPWEKAACSEAPAKTRKQHAKELTKQEKISVVYRLIDFFKTH